MYTIPFINIDWPEIDQTVHKGEVGTATWKTLNLNGLRIRMIEYSAGYLADHWCEKGHIVHCLEGSFTSEMRDGSSIILSKGMTYVVSDDLSSHHSSSSEGTKLLIINGLFLKPLI